nr:hypothetical protein [Stenotrophomonas pavanii]
MSGKGIGPSRMPAARTSPICGACSSILNSSALDRARFVPCERQSSMMGGHTNPGRSFIFMRDIGQFYVISVEGVTRADGTLLQVTRIDCSCIRCSRQFRAIPNHGLVDLDGAAALSCPTCGNHQSVSRARLEELSQRNGE